MESREQFTFHIYTKCQTIHQSDLAQQRLLQSGQYINAALLIRRAAQAAINGVIDPGILQLQIGTPRINNAPSPPRDNDTVGVKWSTTTRFSCIQAIHYEYVHDQRALAFSIIWPTFTMGCASLITVPTVSIACES
jgi:hypothetical protein